LRAGHAQLKPWCCANNATRRSFDSHHADLADRTVSGARQDSRYNPQVAFGQGKATRPAADVARAVME
jgi:hypothetical protein